tara:strand:+ start:3350 stop:3982 length:633 start_codon:yes stop_codon:yes gene_type:complete
MNLLMIGLTIYLLFGIFLSYVNFSLSIKFINDFNGERYKLKKFANGIKRIVYFNNVNFIATALDFFLFFSLLYPVIFIISNITDFDTKRCLKKLTFFRLPLLIIGELPAYKSRFRLIKKDKYYSIYTLNGKSKFYKNNKLHEYSKVFLIKEDNYIAPAISNVNFYHTNEGFTKRFNFEHKKRYFYEGKEIQKMLHSELVNKITQNKINNF